AQDFAQAHRDQQKLADVDRAGYTLLLAMRGWEFAAFTQLRR
ncbi:MAG: XRE family transcriptional regulator, partial [Burkholderiaceae bacterium]